MLPSRRFWGRTRAVVKSSTLVDSWHRGMVLKSSSESFPGFSHLYKLASAGAARAFTADLDLRGADDFAVTRGEELAPPGCSARWAMGATNPSDVIWTRVAAPVLLSERLVAMLREQGFTGWDTYPVTLTDRRGARLPDYHGLSVQGRCGPIDPSRSTRISKEYPAGPFPVARGVYFDESSWDGSDVFVSTDGKGWIFVVEAVQRFFDRARIKNLQLVPLTEFEQMIVE